MSVDTAIVELKAEDIGWNLEPLTPEPVDDDPLIDTILTAMSYRLVMQETLHAMAAIVADYDRLEARYHRLLDERKSTP